MCKRRAIAPLLLPTLRTQCQRPIAFGIHELPNPRIESLRTAKCVDVDRPEQILSNDFVPAKVDLLNSAENPSATLIGILSKREGSLMGEAIPSHGLERRKGRSDEKSGAQSHGGAQRPSGGKRGPTVRGEGDAGQGRNGNSVPRDPATERVVHRHPIQQNCGATRPVGTRITEAHTLGRRMGDETVRTPKQAEPWHLSKDAVEGSLRGGAECGGVQNACAQRGRPIRNNRDVGGLSGNLAGIGAEQANNG